jgi:hypothetical protein
MAENYLLTPLGKKPINKCIKLYLKKAQQIVKFTSLVHILEKEIFLIRGCENETFTAIY